MTPLAVSGRIRYGAPAPLSGTTALTASPTRRTALLMLAASTLALAGCGRRGALELPGETPSPIGGPTPPNPPARAAGEPPPDPTRPPQRHSAEAPMPRPAYEEFRPVSRGQIVPSGQFILDPLL